MAQLYDIISKPFGMLMRGLYALTGNYMIAIFLFTLICEVILIPMAIKQQKNQIKQASLAPRTAAIRKKYAGRNDQATQQKMQNEIMDMYQEEHFNPASGCGTLLIQFPIIILLYNVIRKPLTFISGLTSVDLLGLAQRFGQESVKSANAVDENALSTPNLEMASIKSALIQSATQVILLADSTKLRQQSFARFATMDQVHTLITDAQAPAAMLAKIRDKGVHIEQA